MATERRRRVGWAVSAAVVAVAFAGGWIAARQFQSPAQRESAARPPAAGPLFAAVKRGVLSEQVSASGSVTFDQIAEVTVQQGGVVTGGDVRVGATMRPGDVITEIESRPVFAMPGRFPFYRDLAPGDRGADVAQLQAGLRSAGIAVVGDDVGRYGDATSRAVSGLFARAGYPVPRGLPLADLGVVRVLPARVVSVPAVGARVGDGAGIAWLATGALVVRASFDGAALARVEPGQRATVMVGSRTVPGRVRSVLRQGSRDDPDVAVTFAGRPAKTLAGRAAVVVVTVDAVPHGGLIVPSRAIADDGRGDSHVIVAEHGRRTSVAVRVLGSLNGRSVVEPVDREAGRPALTAGSMVQVG